MPDDPSPTGLDADDGLTLLAFTPDHAAVVSSWARTPAEVAAWCSRLEAPVPPEVIAGWGEGTDVEAFLLVRAGQPVGYGEVWVDDDEAETELARIIVDPAERGRQLGRIMVRRLTAAARTRHDSVILRVRPDNVAAIACYHGAGFARVDAATEQKWNDEQPTQYAWMVHVPPATSEPTG